MAGARRDWRAIHDELVRREQSTLSATELDLLGECLFWLDQPDDSIAVRGRAFTAHAADGDHAGAAMAAWQLFYDHALVGETAVANGWLERARRQCDHVENSAAAGFLAVAESSVASEAGAFDDAVTQAERAVQLGSTTEDSDLLAMGLQAKGCTLVACGRVDEGLAALDEAMVTVLNGELAPLFTGWVFCNALSTCHDLADLGRATRWSNAATRWCDEFADGRFYRGICRLHAVELECLHGAWATAATLAQQACDELAAHDVRYTGDANYVIGELHRLTGDLDLAEEAFTRAHQLGRVPQPGLARVRMSQGRLDAAMTALRLAVHDAPVAPLRRAELLVALTDVYVALADVDAAAATAGDLAAVASDVQSEYIGALAHSTQAVVLLARGDALDACHRAGEAVTQLQSLRIPYDTARARVIRGEAARAVGEVDTARLELTAALETFRRLGAAPDARRVATLLGEARPSPLSARETEVLRLVARGATNKEIAAELTVSEHTVARHLSNIFAKIGVGSRSAATSFAYEHSLI